jgi:glycosyltransferase 2 family protein
MPEEIIKKETFIARAIKLFLKIGITFLCFWYISKKIDFAAARDALLAADWGYVFLAVALLMISKLFSSFRLNIYFRNIDIHLSEWNNIKLYWLGMFYNLFLPGAISGDAYKVILLRRKYNAPYKKLSAAVLLDRFSGLLAIGLILAMAGLMVLRHPLINMVLISGSVLGIAVLYVITRFYFKDFLPGYWSTLVWAMAVQVTQVVCIVCILKSLHIETNYATWIFIFLVAAIISVLPISLGGGLGTREFVFVTGANYFFLDPHIAVIVSLLFYLSGVIAAMWGLYFVFHDPLPGQQNNKPVIAQAT